MLLKFNIDSSVSHYLCIYSFHKDVAAYPSEIINLVHQSHSNLSMSSGNKRARDDADALIENNEAHQLKYVTVSCKFKCFPMFLYPYDLCI